MDTDVGELRVRLTLLRSIVPFGYVNVGGLVPTSLALAFVSADRVAAEPMRWWVLSIWLGALLQLLVLVARPRFWEHSALGWERTYGAVEAILGAAWGAALAVEVIEGEPFTYHVLVMCFLMMTTAACVIAFAGSPLVGRRFLAGQWSTAIVISIALGAYRIALLAALVWVMAVIYMGFSSRMMRTSFVERDRVTSLSHDLAVQASTDSLTGLKNRSATLSAIQQQLDAKLTVTVLFIDLNGFKRINDEFGHAAGDAVLNEFAHRLEGVARSADIVGRLGGDEFVVALTEPADQRHAARVADRIASEIASADGSCPELAISAAVGIARSIEGMSAEDLLSCADDAMYRAKPDGRSRVAGPSQGPIGPELEPLG